MSIAAPLNMARENLIGAALMVTAMLGFAIEDALIKSLSSGLSTGQILMCLGSGGALAFSLLLKAQRKPVLSKAMLTGPVALRNIGEAVGTIGFVTAIVLTPLSSASAILQATPLVVTLAAALFLGEHVGLRRWSAILIGLFGVLLIIRPGLDGFEPASLFAVVGVIGLTLRDVATRRVAKNVDSVQLSVLAFATLVPTGALVMMFSGGWQPVSASEVKFLLIAVAIGIIAYYCITAAMRLGEISVITPFRYSRLIFALFLGYMIFDERPDALTLIGATIIIAAGLYTFLREQQISRKKEAVSVNG